MPPKEAPRAGLAALDRRRASGYVFGVLTAACWAASPIFLRKGLALVPSPLWAVTVGLSAATVPFLVWLMVLRPPSPVILRGEHRDADARTAVRFLTLAGVAAAAGAVARTYAIDLAPVVVVVPLLQTTGLWTILLAPPLLGRHVERVTSRLVMGSVLVAIGAALVIVGQNM
ncbi:MAG: EamA family transporter [Actinomycetota bacterium]